MKDTNLPLAPRYRAAINRIKGAGFVNKTLTALGVMSGLCLLRRAKDFIKLPSGAMLREYAESTAVKVEGFVGSKEGTASVAIVEFFRVPGKRETRLVTIVEDDVESDRILEVMEKAKHMAEGYNLALAELAGIDHGHVEDLQAFISHQINEVLRQHNKKDEVSEETAPTTSAAAAAAATPGPDGDQIVQLGNNA